LQTEIFDLEYLCKIHHHLFADIYEWAGKLRKVDISKGATRFANFKFIESSWNEYVKPKIDNLGNAKDKIYCISEIMQEVNLIHPFREGNGRTSRVFINKLAQTQNITFNWTKITKQENLLASVASVNDDLQPLIEMLLKCVV
jgi:cell filamentation protein